ncbi:hypothetical protein H6775_01150 [Candidatus Nomurabacteria bacterium]|nr:hypothetical protein [Candidatus Nomurabacteria bacterium]
MFSFFNKKSRGFGLVETIVGVAVFTVIAVSAWQAFGAILNGVKYLRIKAAAINLANEQIEVIRNLPYDHVGILQGLPDGKIPHEQVMGVGNIVFLVTTTIRNIDDPFDGEIGGTPNDLSPADNKLVEVQVECNDGCGVPAIVLTTRVAPVALETTGDNGALFIQVFDSNGLPLEGVDVHVENNQSDPVIVIDDETNSEGMLQIVDAPPGTEAYEISVSKYGYSSDRTYAYGDADNPVPDKLHANVVQGQITQVSFSIDKVSAMNITSLDDTCSNVGSLDFQLTGAKVIGLNTYKYYQNHITNSGGRLNLDDLEWDAYSFLITDPGYFLAGTNPILPLNLAPDSEQDVDLIVADQNPNALLVKVVDSSTELPLADAVVTLEKGSSSYEKTTGNGFLLQTDWSGGSGQNNFSNETQYLSDNGNVDVVSSVGNFTLLDVLGEYSSPGELISSVFDTGTSSDFQALEWLPGSQPVETGDESVRFQIATSIDNTATTTWDFVGPDGTSASYFTIPGQSFSAGHDGDRYLKYKTLLRTDSATNTPQVSEVSFTFSSQCTPSGQVYFDGLVAGTYTLTVEKDGYQTFVDEAVAISEEWQDVLVNLTQ